MVRISKYLELPRVFKRESIHQVEFPKEIRSLTENYSEVRNMIKSVWVWELTRDKGEQI